MPFIIVKLNSVRFYGTEVILKEISPL